MATVSFIVPEKVEDKKRQQRRAAAIEALLDLRRQQHPVSDKEVARARQTDRP